MKLGAESFKLSQSLSRAEILAHDPISTESVLSTLLSISTKAGIVGKVDPSGRDQ